MTQAEPMSAPAAVESAASALRLAAQFAAAILDADEKAARLIAVAEGWRLLAIALSQHQAMTPRPVEDNPDPKAGGRW